MKLLTFALFITLLSLNACSTEDEADISGRYAGLQRFGIGQVDSAFVLVLSRQGNVLKGSVTPPFASRLENLTKGEVMGNIVRFERKEGSITYLYEGTIRGGMAQGSFGPLGCIHPASGEACLTDSDGTFTARLQ